MCVYIHIYIYIYIYAHTCNTYIYIYIYSRVRYPTWHLPDAATETKRQNDGLLLTAGFE